MPPQQLYELIGYVASVVVAISLTMSSILRLRIINLIGSIIFAAYGFLIGAVPVGLVNTFIAGVNIYYLAQIVRTREYFRLLPVQPDSAYVRYFLEFAGDDIRRFYPAFSFRPGPDTLAFFVLRDVMPAGILVAEPAGDGTLRVVLDYVLPNYRDFKVARFVYHQQRDAFRDRGLHRVIADAPSAEHVRYYRRVGFQPLPGRTDALQLELTADR